VYEFITYKPFSEYKTKTCTHTVVKVERVEHCQYYDLGLLFAVKHGLSHFKH